MRPIHLYTVIRFQNAVIYKGRSARCRYSIFVNRTDALLQADYCTWDIRRPPLDTSLSDLKPDKGECFHRRTTTLRNKLARQLDAVVGFEA
jgi:hypothetical protein